MDQVAYVEKDIEVRMKAILEAEDILNANSTAFLKMPNLGEEGESRDRMQDYLK